MLKKVIKGFGYAFEGIWTCLKSERNMKIHLVAALVVIILGAIFKITRTEWLVCIVFIALVPAGELFNTAIEAVVDMTSPDKQPLAKLAKDTAAGGVLVLAIGAAAAGAVIFVPYMLKIVGL